MIVLLVSENIGGGVFLFCGQDQGECYKLGFIRFGGESNTKLGDVVYVEIDAVKAIADVEFQELDGAKGVVGQDESMQDFIKDMSNLYGL